MPYTTDAVSTKILRPAGPVGKLATDQRRDNDRDGLHEGPEKYLVGHIGLGAADLLQQVVGLVGGQEGVGQDEHEAADERPREIGTRARVDVERARELPHRPGRPLGRVQTTVVQRGGEDHDEGPADGARGKEHREGVAGEQLYDVGAAH